MQQRDNLLRHAQKTNVCTLEWSFDTIFSGNETNYLARKNGLRLPRTGVRVSPALAEGCATAREPSSSRGVRVSPALAEVCA